MEIPSHSGGRSGWGLNRLNENNATSKSDAEPPSSLYAQWQGKQRSLQRARALRSGATDAENKLWKHLRCRQVEGSRVRRQQPLGPYIVDFFCYEKGLVVEVDGGQHMEREAHDVERTNWLESQGFHVLRFWNNDVLQNVEGAVHLIAERLRNGPHPSLPPQGEGTV